MKPSFKKMLVGGALLAVAASVHAADAPATASGTNPEALMATTLKLIELLVQKGVLTRDAADSLIKESQSASAAPVASTAPKADMGKPGTIRVPYVPEFVKKEIKEDLRRELAAQAREEGWAGPGSVPEWVRRIKLDGDVRFRVQRDIYGPNNSVGFYPDIVKTNANHAYALLNTTEDRDRMLVRARLGMTADIGDGFSAGVRLTTGSTTNPVSESQTLGNYDNHFAASFDLAYIRYHPSALIDASFGRFANSWVGSDLVWANDLTFDGFAAKVSPELSDDVRGFATFGVLPIQQIQHFKSDKWLFGSQFGVNYADQDHNSGRVALAYYRFTNTVGQVSPAGTTLYEYTAPQFTQKGNTYYNISSDPLNKPFYGLAADYHLLNLTATADIPVSDAKHLMLLGDFVHNVGFKTGSVSALLGQTVAARTTGYQLKVAFGQPEVKRKADWQVYTAYKYLERDAVLDAFTDTDFHLGGTDAKGYIIGGSYGVGSNTALGLKYMSADAIDGAPLAIDVLQFDLTTKF